MENYIVLLTIILLCVIFWIWKRQSPVPERSNAANLTQEATIHDSRPAGGEGDVITLAPLLRFRADEPEAHNVLIDGWWYRLINSEARQLWAAREYNRQLREVLTPLQEQESDQWTDQELLNLQNLLNNQQIAQWPAERMRRGLRGVLGIET